MRWTEIKPRFLYHGTSAEGLVGIVMTDEIAANGCEGEAGASLTTNFNIAAKFAWGKSKERAGDVKWNLEHDKDQRTEDLFKSNLWYRMQYSEYLVDHSNGTGGGIFIFDWEKLMQNHRVESHIETDCEDEEEQRMYPAVQDQPVGPILYALVRIDITDHERFKRYEDIMLQSDPELKSVFEVIWRYANA